VFDSKVIRRRRAALAVFVALSLGMLTAYFGEGGGGVLHTLQRGAQEALAPLETGASRALKPARDLFGWFGDTLDAKGENDDLRAELEDLRKRLAAAETARREARQLGALADLRESDGFPAGTEPVRARVIARSPTVWYSSVKIDKGSGDGLRADQPVIAAGGLVGKVTKVTGGTAEVTLITDASSAVSAQVMPNGATGIVTPAGGDPDDLLLDFIPKGRRVTEGTTVVTSGFVSSRVESLFPRGIAIGRVTEVDPDEFEQFQRVHVTPFADVRALDHVEVLTERGVSEQAGVPFE
jgi:rod shape-determining protein MreC